jgi:hypothetical protein
MATSRLNGKSGENSPHLLGNIEEGKSEKTDAEIPPSPYKRGRKTKKPQKEKNKSSVYPPAALSRARRFLVYRSGAETLEQKKRTVRRRPSARRADCCESA